MSTITAYTTRTGLLLLALLLILMQTACKTGPIALLAPVGVVAEADGDRITVSWAASSAGMHHIYVSDNSGMTASNYKDFASPVSSAVSPAIIPALNAFTTYYVVVTRSTFGIEIAGERLVVETGGHKWPVAVSDTFTVEFDTLNGEGGITLAFSNGDIQANDYHPNPARSIVAVDLDPSTPAMDNSFTFPGEGTWNYSNGKIAFTSSETLFKQPTPVSYVVKDDAGNLSAPATIAVRYSTVPKLSATAPAFADVCQQVPVSLSATASSVNGDIETYQWQQIAGTPVNLNGADTATPSFLATQTGDYRFRVTVTDELDKTRTADTGMITAVASGISVWPPQASPHERVRVSTCQTMDTSAGINIGSVNVPAGSLLNSDLDIADLLLPQISSGDDSGVQPVNIAGLPDGSIQIADIRDASGVSAKYLLVTSDFACLLDGGGNKKMLCWGDSAGYAGLFDVNNPGLKRAAPAISYQVGQADIIISAMAVGQKHGCVSTYSALAAGTNYLLCWGDNSDGQLGNSTLSPGAFGKAYITSKSSGQHVGHYIAAGDKHSCTTASTHPLVAQVVKCWGRNDRGQLGIGSTLDQTITIGSNIAIGGAAAAVGYPVGVTPPATILGLKASGSTTCMRGNDRILYCWGANDDGQIGNGTTADQLLATPVDMNADGVINANDRIADFSMGGNTVCAIEDTGQRQLRCWGDNRYGQAKPGAAQALFTRPQQVRDNVQNVWVAANNAVCFTLTGTLSEAWCMGDNSEYQFGTGSSDHVIPVNGEVAVDAQNRQRGMTAVPRLNGMTAYAGAPRNDGASWFNSSGGPGMTSCAILSGQAVCWGTDEAAADGSRYNHPVLGNPQPRYSDGVIERPVAIGFSKALSAFSMAAHHACGIKDDGGVACWGSGHLGVLGDGTQSDSTDRPVDMAGITDAVKVSAGPEHTCVLLNNASVMCSGRGSEGQLMNNAEDHHALPQLYVNTLDAVPVDVDAGADSSCVRLDDGTVACAGNGADFALGNNSSQSLASLSERVLAGSQPLSNVVALDAGNGSCALRNNGDVYCWGANDKGQSGTGAAGSTPTAQQVLSGMHGLARSYASTRCAWKNGSAPQVWCWGDNSGQQAGIAGEEQVTSPVRVGGADFTFPAAITSVSIGGGWYEDSPRNSCALLVNGNIYCWGNGIVQNAVPQPVIGFGQASELYASEYQVCARSVSTLKCMGIISPTSGDIQPYDHRVPRFLVPQL